MYGLCVSLIETTFIIGIFCLGDSRCIERAPAQCVCVSVCVCVLYAGDAWIRSLLLSLTSARYTVPGLLAGVLV